MRIANQKYIARTAFYLLMTAVASLFFVNCGAVNFGTSTATGSSTSASQALSGGGGIDGLQSKYVSYGSCDGKPAQSKAVIVISADQKSASLIRQNCQALNVPLNIDPSQFSFVGGDRARMIFNGSLFDLQTNTIDQVVTLAQCASDSGQVQSLVWAGLGDATALHGSVTQGASSGALLVNLPTTVPPVEYLTSPGQASQFDLKFTSPSSASLRFSIAGAALQNIAQLDCVVQPLPAMPSTPPKSALHYAANGNFSAANVFDGGG